MAVKTVFELFEREKILEHVRETAPYLEAKLDELVRKHDFLTMRRGMGFMQGIVVEGRPVGEIVKRALENGLVVLSAGSNVIRLVPPLTVTKEEIDEMTVRLEKAF
jgi:acetylornithine/N-succinyldiaminopimelate aminotransferase